MRCVVLYIFESLFHSVFCILYRPWLFSTSNRLLPFGLIENGSKYTDAQTKHSYKNRRNSEADLKLIGARLSGTNSTACDAGRRGNLWFSSKCWKEKKLRFPSVCVCVVDFCLGFCENFDYVMRLNYTDIREKWAALCIRITSNPSLAYPSKSFTSNSGLAHLIL